MGLVRCNAYIPSTLSIPRYPTPHTILAQSNTQEKRNPLRIQHLPQKRRPLTQPLLIEPPPLDPRTDPLHLLPKPSRRLLHARWLPVQECRTREHIHQLPLLLRQRRSVEPHSQRDLVDALFQIREVRHQIGDPLGGGDGFVEGSGMEWQGPRGLARRIGVEGVMADTS